MPGSRRSIPFYQTALPSAHSFFSVAGRDWAAAFSCVRPTMQLPFCPFSKVSQFCHFHFAKREQERATQAGLGIRISVESVTRPTHDTMPQAHNEVALVYQDSLSEDCTGSVNETTPRKKRETKHQPVRANCSQQQGCRSISLHFL